MITYEDIFLIKEERQARYGWVEDFQQTVVGKKLVYTLGRKPIPLEKFYGLFYEAISVPQHSERRFRMICGWKIKIIVLKEVIISQFGMVPASFWSDWGMKPER
jgi:hypothetical protein